MPIIQCNGIDIYYEDHGEGEPLVFLHGAMAGIRYFEPQLMGLSDGYRTLAFDFRGHGRSEQPERGHTIEQHARDLDAFLAGLGLDEVVLVGWSMGAIVSWEYLDRFGSEAVRGLVVVDMEPSPMKRPGYDHGTYDRTTVSAALESLHASHLGDIDEQIDALVSGSPSRALRNMMLDEGSRTPPSVQAAMLLDLFLLRDYREVLPTIDVPTLVCAGADESWRSVASVEATAELVPDARFERFEESGHCLTVEEPSRFNQVVRAFVDAL